MAKSVRITPTDAKRIAAPVRKYENYYQFPGPAPRRPPLASSERMVPVICPTAGIPAGSRSTPTNGMGNFAIPGTGDQWIAGDPVKLWNYKHIAVPAVSTGANGDAYWWGGKLILCSWDGC